MYNSTSIYAQIKIEAQKGIIITRIVTGTHMS